MNVTIGQATWGDVFPSSDGYIGCAYDLNTSVAIEYYKIVDNKLVKRNSSRLFPFTEKILFVRAAENDMGNTAVGGQGQDTGKFRTSGLFNVPDVPTYGTSVCDIVPTPTGFIWCVQISGEAYLLNSNEQKFLPHNIWGSSQGIIQVLNGQPVWADLVRTSQPGMLFPFNENGIYVGEGATDPAHIQAIENGIGKNIFNGIAERPRCASVGKLFAVASRGPAGVTFNFYTLPLPNLDVVIPPDPNPEPEPPSMSLPKRVIDTLDRFFEAKCGRYEDGTLKPPLGEDNIRELIIDADEQVAFEHAGEGWGTKRADAGRPVSKDTLSQKLGAKLFTWDLVTGSGTNRPTFSYRSANAHDITGQIFIGSGDPLDDGAVFTPQNHLSGTIPGPDPEPEPPVIDCTPVVPPQNIIRDSLTALRHFCQNYVAPPNALPEYANTKPYVNDEIHEGGLFIGDGLIYFMMSDTGNWAKVLMNPTDTRDWTSKRLDADKALQTYMKRRVGDES